MALRPEREVVLRKVTSQLRTAVVFLALLTGGTLTLAGQAGVDPTLLARLKQLFPAATSFSPKGGEPIHYKAYANGPGGQQSVIGYAYWTTEIVPLERGYGGPIVMLVGMDTKGLLTGLVIAEHHEPYGDFSIDRPAFAATFKNKNVRDAFKLGQDIDAVSRATITMSSAVRAIRNASRRVARELVAPPEAPKP